MAITAPPRRETYREATSAEWADRHDDAVISTEDMSLQQPELRSAIVRTIVFGLGGVTVVAGIAIGALLLR